MSIYQIDSLKAIHGEDDFPLVFKHIAYFFFNQIENMGGEGVSKSHIENRPQILDHFFPKEI